MPDNAVRDDGLLSNASSRPKESRPKRRVIVGRPRVIENLSSLYWGTFPPWGCGVAKTS